MGQAKSTHRVTLKLALEVRGDPGTYGGDTWDPLVKSETSIELPVPKPEEVQYLVGSLVRGLVDIADSKGIPLTGEPPVEVARIERVLAKIQRVMPGEATERLTEAGHVAVLEGIRMILAGEADDPTSELVANVTGETGDGDELDGIGHDVPDALRA